jgi:curved DNA-binding protein CbpA
VKQWHPDRFVHDPRSQRIAEEKLKEINEAYEVVGSAPSRTAYTPPGPQYRQPSGTYQRTAGSYSQASSATTGQRRTAPPRGRPYRPSASAYESPGYSNQKAASSGIPRWVFMLAYFLLMGIINNFHSGSNSTSAPYSEPAPQQVTIPNISFPQTRYSEAQLQQEARQAAAMAARNRSIKSRLPARPVVPISDYPAIFIEPGTVANSRAPNSESSPKLNNYPAHSIPWPGFIPSTPMPVSKNFAKDRTAVTPEKEKIVFQPNPR